MLIHRDPIQGSETPRAGLEDVEAAPYLHPQAQQRLLDGVLGCVSCEPGPQREAKERLAVPLVDLLDGAIGSGEVDGRVASDKD
jgi:hypothetical protein